MLGSSTKVAALPAKYALPSAPKQFISGGGGWGYGVGCGIGPFFGMGVALTPLFSSVFGAGFGIGSYCGVGFGAGAVTGVGAMYIPYGFNWPVMFGPRLERAEDFVTSERTKRSFNNFFKRVTNWASAIRERGRRKRKEGTLKE